MPLSPLAPAAFPDLPVIDGVTFAAAQAGVKYKNRTDVMLALLTDGSTVAGVFTRSATRSAPVLDCQAKLGAGTGPAAILVNSGNSNAFTGRAGTGSVDAICAAVSDATGVAQDRVFTASTGVIGEPLPHDRIIASLTTLTDSMSPNGIGDAARAIMTTDTFAKGATRTVTIDGQDVQIAGIAKGSGMIAPDMATMLVYIFTDAVCAYDVLQPMLARLTDRTFNNITVDSDTSTSDSLMLAATGASGVDVAGNPAFEDALHSVMLDLSHQVVRDGEGATKFVTVAVTGAESDSDARLVAMATANSPLVKTAIAGEDPNWGRIVMAVGKSGAQADRDRLTIKLGDLTLAENGWRSPDYSESDCAAYMKNADLTIGIDLGLGDGACTVWTCDLTHEYIRINADYRS
ncbi:bifunctional glutamate N-acetyltransferase/amino-acid acetyltransferase ArgJ [Loktanella sp. SALINAS62]|uniref:bifunctional glutamate N-acetyltransferase/amino-acid acetyltransferase ArgJ n=1 Tax=Loktanella sp. SALINAS62 TaxID=2706124 RepID=UPI001B8D66F9|nr:bifunctional glutamate N-acetyltransferase/amino-acid acetyltransferase ArgJ [Loktanella sp. SALINAS62]MBS1302490.1 bifunctional glutamate N-acetyltransferase/amino-acid acetyltransferase ArgJ [Loktanella sp. SALINAS62]